MAAEKINKYSAKFHIFTAVFIEIELKFSESNCKHAISKASDIK